MNDRDLLFVTTNFNWQVGQHAQGFHGIHSGYSFCSCNEGGTRLLELCDANNLMVCYTNFKKPVSHLFTYQSDKHDIQIN